MPRIAIFTLMQDTFEIVKWEVDDFGIKDKIDLEDLLNIQFNLMLSLDNIQAAIDTSLKMEIRDNMKIELDKS